MLNFNYIFFTGSNNLSTQDGRKEYVSICLRDLERMEAIHLVNFPLDYTSYPVKRFAYLYQSRKLAKYIKLPQCLLYPFFFKKTIVEEKPLCFVVLDRYFITGKYLSYLKKQYPTARFVLLHRDLMRFCRQNAAEGLMDWPYFDLEMTFDSNEAKEYGMSQFDEFESKIEVPISDDYPRSDVFFAGYVKNRLPNLMKAYEIFTKAGLKVEYYLTGVKLEERVAHPGIEYADKPIPYYEMLYRTINSRCVLEFMQDGAVGNTSRFLEAVMYNKKLITNNASIKDSKFFDPRFIQIVKDASEIDPSFLFKDVDVDYHYNGEFSPIHLIEQIDNELTQNAR